MLSFSLARRICPLKSQVNFWNRLTFLNKHSNTLQRFQGTIWWHFGENFWLPGIRPFETVPGRLIRNIDNRATSWCAQARRICLLKDQVNFWNRLTFLSKHLMFLRSLKEPWFRWNFCEKFWLPGISSSWEVIIKTWNDLNPPTTTYNHLQNTILIIL